MPVNTGEKAGRYDMTKKAGSEIISISIPLDMAKTLGDAMSHAGYKNRSELIRDALRDYLDKQKDLHKMSGNIDGVLVLMYAHQAEKKVHQILHDNMDIFRSFMHLDFDENNDRFNALSKYHRYTGRSNLHCSGLRP